MSAEFAAALTELTRDDRRWFAFALSETGMSSRAIAPIIGVTDRQVRRDVDQVAQVGHHVPPDREDRLGEDLTDRLGGDLEDRLGEDLAEISKITSTTPTNVVVGMDGKTYPTPRPGPERRKPQRRALPDAYSDAIYELNKAAERLERLHADDRFLAHREALGAKHWREISGLNSLLSCMENDFNATPNECSNCGERLLPNRGFESQCTTCRGIR